MDENTARLLQNASYAFANAVGGLIEAIGMFTENISRYQDGKALAYDEKTFHDLMVQRGLHHNSLMQTIYDR